MVARIWNTAEIVKGLLPSLAWFTVLDTVPRRCVPVLLIAGEENVCAAPSMVQVLSVRPLILRLQSFTRYSLQVTVDVLAETFLLCDQSPRSL